MGTRDDWSRRFQRHATKSRLVAVSVLGVVGGCGADARDPPVDTGASSSTTASVPLTTSQSTDGGTTATSTSGNADSATTTSGEITAATSTSDGGSADLRGTSSSTGEGVRCTKYVVLMGYWPPTNEMLRAWSENAAQNPGGWQGADWDGLGFDVVSFFPEFPPDGDPSNDPLGSVGSVGSAESDLRVDYQDTSADFWAIVDEYQPVIVITTSRGGGLGWEVEAIEGGHGGGSPDPAQDWASDGFGPDTRPTQATVEPRTWDAISTYRGGLVLPSQLPMDAIVAAADALALTSVAIDPNGTSGNYLSGFLGLHGVFYAQEYAHVVAAGHIHVGNGLPTADATALIEATLHAVLEAYPAPTLDCPPRR